MFSSIGLFKQVQCPEQSHCSLSNCIFSHSSPPNSEAPEEPKSHLSVQCIRKAAENSGSTQDLHHEDSHEQDVPRKRRRISEGSDDDIGMQDAARDVPRRQPLAGQKGRASPRLPYTATREISPPPFRPVKTKAAEHLLAKADAASKAKSTTTSKLNIALAPAIRIFETSLNPRMIANPPASHAVRMQLITLLHEQMVRLNEEVRQSQDPTKSALRLSPQELVLEALMEEENVAKQNPTVYLNIVKLRIIKLKKMKLAEWEEERLKQTAKRAPIEASIERQSAPKVIDTGLYTSQEIAFLSKMLAKQNQLTKYGYVATAPSDEEVAKAREGVEAAQGWEECDRCKTRFQVFPGRRAEDGALTSGGTCSYHPAKPRRPIAKDKADKGHKDLMYACCNEAVGTSAGCTSASTHVFKVSETKRLALIMPFEQTPPKPLTPGPNLAVCFDCEMGYTTIGLELIRLTATSWPDGEELLDVLVRPLGEILDLNSQFSGVWPNDYVDALPHKPKSEGDDSGTASDSRLRIVDSPVVARDLLFELLTPETPLIGHALDNDLNSTRIIHPSIVDSVLLYPHPRGLPIRFGLKLLMKKHLDRDIQMGGADGHDSKEDARAAGDLVRLKVADTWKAMKRDGWTVKKTEFLPPLPSASTVANSFGTYGT